MSSVFWAQVNTRVLSAETLQSGAAVDWHINLHTISRFVMRWANLRIIPPFAGPETILRSIQRAHSLKEGCGAQLFGNYLYKRWIASGQFYRVHFSLDMESGYMVRLRRTKSRVIDGVPNDAYRL